MDEARAMLRRGDRRLRERRCRLAARPRQAGGRVRVNILESLPLYVDAGDQGLSRRLSEDAFWEMWLTEALEEVLSPGMTAVDIGANVGYFTMLMAERVGRSGRVHAFEANPAMADILTDSIVLAGFGDRVAVYRDPLWDSEGEACVLKVPSGEPKNAHLITGAGGDVEGIRMSTRRADSFPELGRADVIKIDVEGAEERIWRGMEGVLASGRPLTIFLEFSPVRYEAPMMFLEAISAHGFALGELSVSHGIRTVTTDQILAGDPTEDRILALTRGSAC